MAALLRWPTDKPLPLITFPPFQCSFCSLHSRLHSVSMQCWSNDFDRFDSKLPSVVLGQHQHIYTSTPKVHVLPYMVCLTNCPVCGGRTTNMLVNASISNLTYMQNRLAPSSTKGCQHRSDTDIRRGILLYGGGSVTNPF